MCENARGGRHETLVRNRCRAVAAALGISAQTMSRPADPVRRSQGRGEVDRAGDRGADRADLRARARRRGHEESRRRIASCCSCTAPARRPRSRSTCRTGDYSWMAYLAKAGFDVFSMDMTGYGRSTRPAPMNDPCNLSAEQQTVCSAVQRPARRRTRRNSRRSHPTGTTSTPSSSTFASCATCEKVSLVGLVARRPARGRLRGAASRQGRQARAARAGVQPRRRASNAPHQPRARRGLQHAVRTRVHANWDRQVGCPNQYDPTVRDAVWAEMLASDPVGATWGTGVRRAPSNTTWGLERRDDRRQQEPTLMIAGAHDKQVPPDRVREPPTTISAPRTRCWSISAARRTTRCGRRTTCCCSAPRSSG